MKVLVACERSGKVRDAFIRAGHYAVSCDMEPSESAFGEHIIGDVRQHLKNSWDMVIAHPPCTYLCNSGVRWLHKEQGRWQKMFLAAEFFNECKNANAPIVVCENPIPHKYAVNLIGRYSQIIQPWEFGHDETKATCFWLKNCPPLLPTLLTTGREQRVHKLPPSKDRGYLRAITYDGIANAMAMQWG